MAPPPPPSSGILSNVFSFVSRELESFVTNATGGTTTQAANTPSEASSSRVKLSETRRRRDSAHESRSLETYRRDDEPRTSRMSRHKPPEQPPNSSPRCRHEEEPVERSSRSSKRKGEGSSARSRSPPRTATQEDRSKPNVSRSASPPNLPPQLKKKPSVVMPGSLFPRSPSPESEPPLNFAALDSDEPHTRSDTAAASPHSKRARASSSMSVEEVRNDRSASSSSRRPGGTEASDIRTRHEHPPGSPFRPRTLSSVQDAIRKFQPGPDEAGPSILLPNSPGSPSKGKEKESDRRSSAGGNRNTNDVPASSLPTARSWKGKEKEGVDIGHHRHDDPDSSGMLRIRGKERELSVALEEQRRKERDWERDPEKDRDRERIEQERRRDKELIRRLEEEVRRLRDELARRPVVHVSRDDQTSRDPPPPPPPPLPPVGVTPRLPTTPSAGADSLLMAVRASLKHAGTPKEAPINAGPTAARPKRAGQPTVNVPSDKMAAFLNEMKTVRLRKVSSGGSMPPPRPPSAAGTASLSRSFSIDGLRGRNHDFQQNAERGSISLDVPAATRNWLNDLAKTSEKRKRDEDSHVGEHTEELRAAVKRRYDWNTSIESTSSATSSSSTSAFTESTSQTSTSLRLDTSTSTRARPLFSKPSNSLPLRPSINVTDTTDLTTPSLCSDRDVDNEEAPSPDDKLLHTPPTLAMDLPESISRDGPTVTEPNRPGFYVEPIRDDVSRLRRHPTPPPPRDRTFSLSPSPPPNNVFAKRIPSSPMPTASPRRPKPPGRILGKALRPPRPQAVHVDESDEDPLSLSQGGDRAASAVRSRPLDRSSREVSARSRSASRNSVTSDRGDNRASSRKSRRDTLDDELQRAHASFVEHCDENPFESDVYLGVGQKSKRTGFLAHGGAGGIPVFMGEGYVEGVEPDDASKIPRLAQRTSAKRRPGTAIRRKK